MTERCCIIIPVYRHVKPLLSVLQHIAPYNLPCFLIDDRNEPPLQEALSADLSAPPLASLAEGGRSWVEVLRLPAHGGKGAACLEGCRRALEKGFTHAIFLDADDQHDTGDIPQVLALLRQHPDAMILGRPVFDQSAPLERRIGRIISNMWVWLETWSFEIRDSLCGFRCLPLAPVAAIASRVRLGRRMDFDPDIVVRLFWQGIPVVPFNTLIRYPSEGHSNFDMLKDNAALFRLHTRLVIGMLLRWPLLVQNRWRHG